jgi:hypothetical protein
MFKFLEQDYNCEVIEKLWNPLGMRIETTAGVKKEGSLYYGGSCICNAVEMWLTIRSDTDGFVRIKKLGTKRFFLTIINESIFLGPKVPNRLSEKVREATGFQIIL